MPDPGHRRDGSALPPAVTGTVVTVGTFDGVHRGHLDVVHRLVDRAQTVGLPSLLVSFDPHPLEVVNPAAAPQLLTLVDEKLEVLAQSGLDYFAVLPFTPTLASFGAETFVEEILRHRFRMVELLIGHDHGFGHRRAGNVAVLQEIGARSGFRVEVVEPVSLSDGQHVSSTAIRRAIAGGDLDRAVEGLGRPYSMAGSVVRGHSRGRDLGFATINLASPSPRKLLPPDGVYAVVVHTLRAVFKGMMNLGARPTFGEFDRTAEAHLFDASEDLYGARVRVDFLAFLRHTRKFESPDALAEQLRKDRDSALRALTPIGEPGNLTGYTGTANPTSSLA